MMHFQDVLNNFITVDQNIIKGLILKHHGKTRKSRKIRKYVAILKRIRSQKMMKCFQYKKSLEHGGL